MKTILCLFTICGILVACDNSTKINSKPVYICGNYELEMTISEDGNTMHAIISGDAADLTLTQSASGAKYTGTINDTTVVMWGKGDTWTMFVGPEETMIECFVK